MKLPSILIQDKGFTLIEIIIVLAIFAGLSVMGLIIGIDAYSRYLFQSDLSKAATLLQKARSSALSNIGETSHGVYFGDPEKFILFRGASFATRDALFDRPVDKSKAVATTGLTEIAYTPLSGTTTDGTVVLNDGIRSATIIINHEGLIDW